MRRVDNLTTFYVLTVLKSGSHNLLEPSGPGLAWPGLAWPGLARAAIALRFIAVRYSQHFNCVYAILNPLDKIWTMFVGKLHSGNTYDV